uniref:Putative secreted protein n=1 Tax=Rhipicephalus microplus TaxID=6941 RepID=A0A6M2DDA5_RHIMP
MQLLLISGFCSGALLHVTSVCELRAAAASAPMRGSSASNGNFLKQTASQASNNAHNNPQQMFSSAIMNLFSLQPNRQGQETS